MHTSHGLVRRAVGVARVCSAACSVVGVFAIGAAPARTAIPPYTLVGSYTLPAGAGPYTVLADGTLLLMQGGTFLRQSAVNTGAFAAVGSVQAGLISPFGASFVAVSPDGATLAVGDGNFGPAASVHFVSVADLSASAPSAVRSAAVSNAEGRWLNSTTLFVTGADASFNGQVARIDAPTLTARTVIAGVGGASGGIALDGQRLYTGNGFTFNPPGAGSQTGDIKAFDLTALAGPGLVDFESSGVTVARALSANSLGFDGVGNLLVGGGDFFTSGGDRGAAVVVDAEAITAALAGGGVAPPSGLLRLSPAGEVFYGVTWNTTTQELLVIGGGTVHRYAVPAPGGAAVALLAGAMRARRRRHA